MSRYQGQHRADPARGRHRTWPTERAVDSLFGASTALTAGALAAIFLSGSAVLPDDGPGAPSFPGGDPAVAAPGDTGRSGSSRSAVAGALDLAAMLTASDASGCTSCGGAPAMDVFVPASLLSGGAGRHAAPEVAAP